MYEDKGPWKLLQANIINDLGNSIEENSCFY